MGERHIYIDTGPGETRGVLAGAGGPERLFIERVGAGYPRLGERYGARVAKIERSAGLAILDLGAGQAAVLRLKPDRAPPAEGRGVEVEISIEPQGDKLAVARSLQARAGAPGLLGGNMELEARLQVLAPGAEIVRGPEAREAADEASETALAVDHRLPNGGSLAIETTRALTAVDVDLGAGGGRDAKRATRYANIEAIAVLARLMRLKALGGLVVVDLVGRGHDGPALARAVQGAFAPEQPGVVVGPVTKFGTLELAVPRRWRPLRDILCDGTGRPSDQTLALALLRAAEREARANPGSRLAARAAPSVAAAAAAYMGSLTATVGGRVQVVADPTLGRERFEISAT